MVPFIDEESRASHASLIADRSPLGDNPRYYTGIKLPLNFFVKPFGLGMFMRALPATPEALLEELSSIFPQYRARSVHDETPTHHSVLMAFTPFFGGQITGFSERQLRVFAELVNAAVAAGGSLANAFETCLLEHLHQIGATRTFRPYLSQSARERTHA